MSTDCSTKDGWVRDLQVGAPRGELAGPAVLIPPFVFLWQISLREAQIKLLF